MSTNNYARQKTSTLRCRSYRRLRPVCLSLVLLWGCALQGPSAMRASQPGYNDALKLTEQRELLLNLVRMRYTEAPEFLSVSGISTQMTFEAGATIAGETGGSVSLVKPDVNATYSEKPTLSFTPRRDQDFTRQMLTPIDLEPVYLLTNYGWGIDRVLRILARGVNGRENDIARERTPTCRCRIVATGFTQMTRTWRPSERWDF